MTWRKCSVGMLLAVALCVLAGCGGDGRLSKDAYRAALAKVGKATKTAERASQRDGRSAKTVPDFVAVMRRFADSESKLGDEVAGLKPPADAEAANNELAKGEHDEAMEIRALLPKIEKFTTIQQVLAYLNRFGQTQGIKEQDEALSKLQQLGYTRHAYFEA